MSRYELYAYYLMLLLTHWQLPLEPQALDGGFSARLPTFQLEDNAIT